MKNSNYISAIQACKECAEECNKCANEALNSGLFKNDDISLLLERNCADMCNFTATLLQTGFRQAEHLAKDCAKACEAFAAECVKHNGEVFKKCADACLKCSAECRRLLIHEEGYYNSAA